MTCVVDYVTLIPDIGGSTRVVLTWVWCGTRIGFVLMDLESWTQDSFLASHLVLSGIISFHPIDGLVSNLWLYKVDSR